MTLKSETTVEYFFRNAYLYYCKEHSCLRIVDDHEDSVLFSGVEQKRINAFISAYMNFVLDNQELQATFDKAVNPEKEAVEDE